MSILGEFRLHHALHLQSLDLWYVHAHELTCEPKILDPSRLTHHTHPLRHGYTLFEVVISSLIVGGVLVGALNVLGGAMQTNKIAASRLDAPGLGYQLMAEILALPYEDPEEPDGSIGLENGETNTTRADFDDLDDYDLWDNAPAETKDGTPVPGGSGWRRKVRVEYFDPANGNTTNTDTGVKVIRIQVVAPSGLEFKLDTLRSRWGALERPPAIDTNVVSSLDAELLIGRDSEVARASIHLKNHAYDQ